MKNVQRHIPALIVALLISMVPHLTVLPPWVALWCLTTWGIILLRLKAGRGQPGRGVRLLLILGGTTAVFLNSGGGLDRFSGINLLWIMAGIKMMEIQTQRDVKVMILLTYFLTASILFFDTGLFAGLYAPAALLVVTVVLSRVVHPSSGWRRNLSLAAGIFFQALPLTLVLFLFFPRGQGGLWGLQGPQAGISGFSDQLRPGGVSQVVVNRAIAFRAEFAGSMPAPGHLYWRGLTFTDFDGDVWRTGDTDVGPAPSLTGSGKTDYTVTLEPHGQRWLFAIDSPVDASSGTVIKADHTLMSIRRVARRLQYSVQSLTDYKDDRADVPPLATVKLPDDSNPQARDLARRWRAAAQEPAEIVQTALRYFSQNEFGYTLQAPLLGRQAIDEFLFRTRKGYCGHYASAFVFLMRAANIPARVVAGYLGGDVNPYGGYLIVRQSHAHAWAEVWLQGKGWRRVDPSLAIAPQRVDRGVASALPQSERAAVEAFGLNGRFSHSWNNIHMAWDAVDNQWNKWVMGYTLARQKTLLAGIGLDTGGRKGLLFSLLAAVGSMGLIAGIYAARYLKTVAVRDDEVRRSYRLFCSKLARVGLVRSPGQGPLDFATAVNTTRRDLKERVAAIIALYIRLRYDRRGDSEDLKRFKVAVRQFKAGEVPDHRKDLQDSD
jgi:protein-glutamine gamma-glutamyltransferase